MSSQGCVSSPPQSNEWDLSHWDGDSRQTADDRSSRAEFDSEDMLGIGVSIEVDASGHQAQESNEVTEANQTLPQAQPLAHRERKEWHVLQNIAETLCRANFEQIFDLEVYSSWPQYGCAQNISRNANESQLQPMFLVFNMNMSRRNTESQFNDIDIKTGKDEELGFGPNFSKGRNLEGPFSVATRQVWLSRVVCHWQNVPPDFTPELCIWRYEVVNEDGSELEDSRLFLGLVAPDVVNWIGRLNEFLAQRRLGASVSKNAFISTKAGPDHAPTFAVRLEVLGRVVERTGAPGQSLQEVRHAAARAMLEDLRRSAVA